jgi:diaminohydroxyphosphoribosylaminopyrimidine deaminase/5-amino-6-(5-phosphoribosylamino)uracil reductase
MTTFTPSDTDADLAGMGLALAAAWTARRSTSPRPWVGAAVVPDGVDPCDPRVVTGATDGTTGPHAEVCALRAAGDDARGGTLYVTLEPCSHHGRTPPCADAVIEAGVARVVVALEDPDVNVSGQGLQRLRDAGIAVDVGVGAPEAAEQLAPYLHHRRTGRPFVVLKLAATMDGRIAAPDGSSRWITGEQARLDAHRLRADSDAVLVGAGTVRSDDPELTVRLPECTATGHADDSATDSGDRPGAVRSDVRQPRRLVLGDIPSGARIEPAESVSGPLVETLDRLGSEGVLQLLVEGGAHVAHDLHSAGLVDRYVLYLAPALLGGDDGMPLFAGPGAPTLGDAWRGSIVATTQLGDDLRIDLAPLTDDEVH